MRHNDHNANCHSDPQRWQKRKVRNAINSYFEKWNTGGNAVWLCHHQIIEYPKRCVAALRFLGLCCTREGCRSKASLKGSPEVPNAKMNFHTSRPPHSPCRVEGNLHTGPELWKINSTDRIDSTTDRQFSCASPHFFQEIDGHIMKYHVHEAARKKVSAWS